MHYIIELFQYTFHKKNFRLFIIIFCSVFVIITYAGKLVLNEFDRLKDSFLEDLSSSINKKIHIGNISGDYLYNLNIKNISVMNQSDNTVYVNIPDIDIEYNVLRIILDSKNGLNYIKQITLKNFEFYLREGFFEGLSKSKTSDMENKTSSPFAVFEKIKRLKIELVNGKISRTFWGSREIVLENINGSYTKENYDNKIRLTGVFKFYDGNKILSSDFALYFYKTDNDEFTSGVIHLRNIKYDIFYIKETTIGVTIDKNGIRFASLERSNSTLVLENIFNQIFEPSAKYDKLPSFSGYFDFKKQILDSELEINSSPETVNKAYNYFIRPNVSLLFPYGFYPQGKIKLQKNFLNNTFSYSTNLFLPNFLKAKDKLILSLTGNLKEISINNIKYENEEGLFYGNGRYIFGKLVPDLDLYCEQYLLPIRGGIHVSSFIRLVQTSEKGFDVIFEDIDSPPFQKKFLKISFTINPDALVITTDTIINDKLKTSVIIPKHSHLITLKLDFNDLQLDDLLNAINTNYYYEIPVDTIDRDRYIIRGNISATIGGKIGYNIDANINVLNSEINDKYLVKTVLNFQNNTLNILNLDCLDGNSNLKGKIKFEDNYIFPEIKGFYRKWDIDLSARIMTGPDIVRIEGLLNHSLTFNGTITNDEIKAHFDFDDFVFVIGRKPIMLSDSFTLIYDKIKNDLTGGGTVIWHNIDLFESKKTGIWVHFSLLNNILTANEVVFFSDFSSLSNINLESGVPGYGRVWIDTEYARVCVEAYELENRWKAYFSYGFSSDIVETFVTFNKSYDFTRVDKNFYSFFMPDIVRGDVTGGFVDAIGPDYDVNIRSTLVFRDALWNGLKFSGNISLSLLDDILVMKEVKLFNERGKIEFDNIIIALNDTWQINLNGRFDLTFLHNQFSGEIVFNSYNIQNDNKVSLFIEKFMINNKIMPNIELAMITDNMRFHDIDKDKWSLKIFSLNSNNFVGKINRSGNLLNVDVNYFISEIGHINLEGNIEGKKLNLLFYSTPIDLSFVNSLSTGLENIGGRFRYNLNLKGSLSYPELYGYIKLVDGRFNVPGFTNTFKDIKAYLNFDNRKLNITYLEGENGSEKIKVSGFASFEEWSKPNLALNLKTINNKGLNFNFSKDMFSIKGRIMLDIALQGENGINKLSGSITLEESLITITPFRLSGNKVERIDLHSNKDKDIFDTLGLNLDLIVGSGVDFRLNPEILEIRINEGNKINIYKEPGSRKNIALKGFFESNRGMLKAYNSLFNVTYAKLDFRNEPRVYGDEADKRRVNKLYLTLNTRTILKDEKDERVDVYLDFNGEINENILSKFNDYLVMRIPSGKPEREVLALLGTSGEGLSLLLSPVLNVFRDQLGFIDRIEGKTEAFENLTQRRRSSDTITQAGITKLNPLHNTEFRIGKFINLFGLFNNNLYLKYAYIFKQDPIGNEVSGYHKVGFDWTVFSYENVNLQLQFEYSPYDIGMKYKYQPIGMFIANILF